MKYLTIDAIVNDWAKRHSLTIFTSYRDAEVRSTDIVSAKGRRFQIWIDEPENDRVQVHTWDYRKRRRDWDVSIMELEKCLEEALVTVQGWSHE